jgi:hypothetical protein
LNTCRKQCSSWWINILNAELARHGFGYFPS